MPEAFQAVALWLLLPRHKEVEPAFLFLLFFAVLPKTAPLSSGCDLLQLRIHLVFELMRAL